MANNKDPKRSGAWDALKNVQTAIGAVTTAIAACAATVGFIHAHGGPIFVLSQIGIFGFACYVGLIPGGFIYMGFLTVMSQLDKVAGRESGSVIAIIGGILILFGCGFFIRFVIFYPGFGQPGDLDGIGTAFLATLGGLIIAIPVFTWLYIAGSKPAKKESR